MEDWFKKNYEKDLNKQLKQRRIKFKSVEPQKLMKHDLTMKEAISKFGVTWRNTALYTNATWYCPESNRIYSVTLAFNIARPIFLKRNIIESEYTDLMKNLLSSLKCH